MAMEEEEEAQKREYPSFRERFPICCGVMSAFFYAYSGVLLTFFMISLIKYRPIWTPSRVLASNCFLFEAWVAFVIPTLLFTRLENCKAWFVVLATIGSLAMYVQAAFFSYLCIRVVMMTRSVSLGLCIEAMIIVEIIVTMGFDREMYKEYYCTRRRNNNSTRIAPAPVPAPAVNNKSASAVAAETDHCSSISNIDCQDVV